MNVHARAEPPMRAECRNILGIEVASLDWGAARELLWRLVGERRFTKVGFLNAHNANIAIDDKPYARALGHFLVLPDGIGVDIAAQILYGAPFRANLNGTDFIPDMLRGCPEPLKIGLLGARLDSARRAAAALRRLAPQHRVSVIRDGYFGPEDEPALLAELAGEPPDVLLVAMGVPRQELWIERNLTEEHCTMPIAVGALFDFLSGAVPRAPVWMRRMRLEWVYRLIQEPSRLSDRYVIGNPLFLSRVLRQRFSPERR